MTSAESNLIAGATDHCVVKWVVTCLTIAFFISSSLTFLCDPGLLAVRPYAQVGLPKRHSEILKRVCYWMSVITCFLHMHTQSNCAGRDNEGELSCEVNQAYGCSRMQRKCIGWKIDIQLAKVDLLFLGLQFSSSLQTLHIPHLLIHSVFLHFSACLVCSHSSPALFQQTDTDRQGNKRNLSGTQRKEPETELLLTDISQLTENWPWVN